MIKKELYAAPQTEVLELRLGSSVLEVVSTEGVDITRGSTDETYEGGGENWYDE